MGSNVALHVCAGNRIRRPECTDGGRAGLGSFAALEDDKYFLRSLTTIAIRRKASSPCAGADYILPVP